MNPDLDVAQPNADFTYAEDQPFVIFNDGGTSVPIAMKIIDDDIPELIEIFHVNLTQAILIDQNGNDAKPLLPPKIGS